VGGVVRAGPGPAALRRLRHLTYAAAQRTTPDPFRVSVSVPGRRPASRLQLTIASDQSTRPPDEAVSPQTSLLRPAQPHPNPSRIPDRWIQAKVSRFGSGRCAFDSRSLRRSCPLPPSRCSSTGQSMGLLRPRLQVRVLPAVQHPALILPSSPNRIGQPPSKRSRCTFESCRRRQRLAAQSSRVPTPDYPA
jgi:hypothetical protein